MTEHDAQDAVQGLLLNAAAPRDLREGRCRAGQAAQPAAQGLQQLLPQRMAKGAAPEAWRGCRASSACTTSCGAEDRLSKDLLAPGLSAEKLYAREWARAVLDRSLATLRQHYADRGHGTERFTCCCKSRSMQEDDAARLDHASAAGADMAPGALRAASAPDARRNTCERIERELAVTLDTNDPAEIQAEIGDRFRAFD